MLVHLSVGGPGSAQAAGAAVPHTVRFVHLSDTHCALVRANPRPRSALDPHRKDLVRSFAWLQAAVRLINDDVGPDFVALTGDLVDRPDDVVSLRRVKGLLEQLDCPWYPVIGNHDGARAWRQVFGRSRFNYTFTCKGWHFVVVDSSRGYLSRTTRTWLEQALRAAEGRVGGVFLHHPLVMPPLVCRGIKAVYGFSPLLRDAEETVRLVEGAGGVRGVFAGHAHVDSRMHRGTVAYHVAPALCGLGHYFHVVTLGPGGVHAEPVMVHLGKARQALGAE